eukprot:jgi/Psemu1/69018/estExt_Genemark1.C_6700004
MDGFSDIFKKLEKKAQKLMDGDNDEDSEDEAAVLEQIRRNSHKRNITTASTTTGEDYEVGFKNSNNPTRWEKAVLGLHGMVKQVSRVDPDGLDIVCFGGSESEDPNGKISLYRNVKNVKDVEEMVTSKLPGGPCHMGKAMDFALREAFERGFDKRPCGILVMTAGIPDDSDRLETSLRQAAERIAKEGYKESPLSVTFVHVGDDKDAEEYMQHLDKHMVSKKKSRKTWKKVDIVDTIRDSEIKAAMAEIKGTKSTGTTGAIIGAFAGAAMGVGGMYLYNKKQAKKRTEGWNGKWKATYDNCEIAVLDVKDDLKGKLTIEGFPGGRTNGRYAERQQAYNITFRDADEGWTITGDIENEHTIFWSDGTRWDEIPPKGAKWGHYAGAAAAGAATGGAVGYLLDKKFVKKAHKNDQADYVILVDRSAQMAVQDSTRFEKEYSFIIEEYKPETKEKEKEKTAAPSSSSSSSPLDAETKDAEGEASEDEGLLATATQKLQNLSTEQKVAIGVAGAAAVAAAGVGVVHVVKTHKNKNNNNNNNDDDPDLQVVQARSLSVGLDESLEFETHIDSSGSGGEGLSGNWRATFDGDELASLVVKDDGDGILTIAGFFGGKTIGKYTRNSVGRINKIHFIDADENWAVHGDVKGGEKENVIIWKDGTRWDRIA